MECTYYEERKTIHTLLFMDVFMCLHVYKFAHVCIFRQKREKEKE